MSSSSKISNDTAISICDVTTPELLFHVLKSIRSHSMSNIKTVRAHFPASEFESDLLKKAYEITSSFKIYLNFKHSVVMEVDTVKDAINIASVKSDNEVLIFRCLEPVSQMDKAAISKATKNNEVFIYQHDEVNPL